MRVGVDEARWRAALVSLRTLRDDESAPTAVEYGIMLSGIAAAIFASVASFGQAVLSLFDAFVSAWP